MDLDRLGQQMHRSTVDRAGQNTYHKHRQGKSYLARMLIRDPTECT